MRWVLPCVLLSCARPPLSLPSRPDLVLAERTLSFADRTWWMRADHLLAGAGYGWWSEEAQVVDGALELQLARSDRWRGMELLTPLPRDTREVEVTVEVGTLPVDVTAGIFLYRSDHSELDVELGRWGDATAVNAQYAVGPASRPGNVWRFGAGEGVQTHRIAVRARTVGFSSTWAGGQAAWVYEGPDQPERAPHALHLNLWPMGPEPRGRARIRVLDVVVR